MNKTYTARRVALSSASLATLILALGAPAAALAQGGETEVESVVVTASRIVRDGYEAPTPTTVVGLAEIEKQSPSNIADYVNKLPQLGSAAGNSPRTVSFNSSNPGGGTNSLNLRNLNPVRTLTLLDGHRVVPASTTGVVDINLLPTNLVARVDVVTGGASAAWGSDAVAGVVNFVLDKTFTGAKGSVGYGSSWRGDGSSFNADLAFGAKFAGGRGHILLSGKMEDLQPIFKNSSRDWYVGYKAIPNAARTPTNGQPGYIAVDKAGLRVATAGGVIVAGPLAGVQFGQGGAVLPYRIATAGGGIVGVGGDVQDFGGDYPILSRTKDQSLFARVSYDLADNVNAFAEAGVGWDYGVNYTSAYVRFGDLTIRAENPFIPAGLNLQGLTSFNIGRYNNEDGMGPTQVKNRRRQERFVAGLEGDTDWFNSSFKWNAYYQHGVTHLYQEVSHVANVANYNRAVDVIRNPATGGVAGIAVGAPVCRSTITDPGNGCQPFNVFGEGSPSAAAIAYVTGVSWQKVTVQEDVAAAGFQFDPFSLPAGAVSIAGGAEWRKERFHNEVDPLDANPAVYGAAPFQFGNYKLARGEFNVKEAFGELIVPVLKDLPGVKALDFNGAARLTDYSTSGSVKTWKVGGTWDVTTDLRLRATRSRDIRAPNLNDLFLAGAATTFGASPPNSSTQVAIVQITGGNPNLTPEIADTTAYGVVYRPSWLPGFSASVDYYKVGIRDAIVVTTAQQIINLCFGVGVVASPAACANISPPSPTLIGASVRVGGANIARADVAGYDIEIGYRTQLSDLSSALTGGLDLRAVGSNLTRYTQTIGGITSNYKGMVTQGNLAAAGGPEWRWLFTGSYSLGPSTTTATVRYVGPAVINNEPRNSVNAVDINKVKPVSYLDINQSWDLSMFGRPAQVFAQLQNVFDTDPPKVSSNAGSGYVSSGSEVGYYDLVGRSWRIGFRFKY